MLMYLVPRTLAALICATESTGNLLQDVLRQLHFEADQPLRILRARQGDAVHLADRNAVQVDIGAFAERRGVRHVRIDHALDSKKLVLPVIKKISAVRIAMAARP